GRVILTRARVSRRSPPCWARARSSIASGGTSCPRRYPAATADPPVGSASTSSTGLGHVNASPSAVVVTPGDPDADANTIRDTAPSPVPGVEHDRDPTGRGHRRQTRRVTFRDLGGQDRLSLPDTVQPRLHRHHHGVEG